MMSGVKRRSADDGTLIGLRNYTRALGNPLLYDAIRATGVYSVIVLPIEILLGLSFALLVHRTVRWPGVRAAIYVLAILPLVVPPVAIGVVARLVYAPSYGVLNVILERVGLTHHEVNWLGDPTLAMLAVASVDIWQWTPFVYLVLFSTLVVRRHLIAADEQSERLGRVGNLHAHVGGLGPVDLHRHLGFPRIHRGVDVDE